MRCNKKTQHISPEVQPVALSACTRQYDICYRLPTALRCCWNMSNETACTGDRERCTRHTMIEIRWFWLPVISCWVRDKCSLSHTQSGFHDFKGIALFYISFLQIYSEPSLQPDNLQSNSSVLINQTESSLWVFCRLSATLKHHLCERCVWISVVVLLMVKTVQLNDLGGWPIPRPRLLQTCMPLPVSLKAWLCIYSD